MFWQFLEVKFSSLHAETTAHTCAPKNTPMSCVNCGLPPFRLVCFSHPVWPAVIIQPINPERARKALILDTCLLLARGDIFTLWPEEISTLLLTGASGSHLTDLISLISLRRHNHLTAKDPNNQTNRVNFKKTGKNTTEFYFSPKIIRKNRKINYILLKENGCILGQLRSFVLWHYLNDN